MQMDWQGEDVEADQSVPSGSTVFAQTCLSKYFGSVITETSPYSFGNFRKLSLYNCFMPI